MTATVVEIVDPDDYLLAGDVGAGGSTRPNMMTNIEVNFRKSIKQVEQHLQSYINEDVEEEVAQVPEVEQEHVT